MKQNDLYFITDGDFIKIGSATNVHKRLIALQIGNPRRLRLLIYFLGIGDQEDSYRFQLNHLHVSGEWLKYTDEVDKLIVEIAQEMDGKWYCSDLRIIELIKAKQL